MSFYYLNGRILPAEEAKISVNDRAVLFGDGAYETIRSYGGRFFRFPEHLARLRQTLEGMQIELSTPDDLIIRGAIELIEANRLPDARLRLTVTGGEHDGNIRLRRSHEPNLILAASPLVSPPEAAYRDGVAVIISPWRVHTASPLPRIKTINRLTHLMAKEEALQQEAWDALFLDEAGNILEGTTTNVFFVIEGELHTPSLAEPLLAGVTRDLVLEIARESGLAVREGKLPRSEARGASEAFLTGSTIEILPVKKLDGLPIGTGRAAAVGGRSARGESAKGGPGPVARDLLARYREVVARETGGEPA